MQIAGLSRGGGWRPCLVLLLTLTLFPAPAEAGRVNDNYSLDKKRLASEGESSGGPAKNSPFTGTFTYSQALELPPGRLGVEPPLELRYASGGRDGWVGTGWTLTLGSIERQTRDGVDFSAEDFLFADQTGPQRLVKVATGHPLGDEYRLEREKGSYLRFFFKQRTPTTEPTSYWTMLDKRGRTFKFGNTEASGQHASTYDLSDLSRVFAWHLVSVTDANGNVFYARYYEDTVSSVDPALKEIHYTGNGELGFDNHVFFNVSYRAQTDRSVDYAAGFARYNHFRLDSIHVEVSGTQASRYAFNYDQSPVTYRERLLSIDRFGSDDTTQLPTISFRYTGEQAVTFERVPLVHGPGYVFDHPNSNYLWSSGDFNGDGCTDLLHHVNGDYIHTWLSDCDGTFTVSGYNPPPHRDVTGPEDRFRYVVADWNGDGMDDMLHQWSGHQMDVWISDGDGTFTISSVGYDQYNQIFPGCEDPPCPKLNQVGNNYTYVFGKFRHGPTLDMLLFEDRYGLWYFRNDFDEQPPYRFSNWAMTQFPWAGYAYPVDSLFGLPSGFRPGDFNGDGLTDLMHFTSRSTYNMWQSDGAASFGVTGESFPSDLGGVPHRWSASIGDFNGDGRSDVLNFHYLAGSWDFPEDQKGGLFFGKGRRFAPAVDVVSEIEHPVKGFRADPPFPDPLFIGDFNGDRRQDVLQVNNTPNGGLAQLHLSKGNGEFVSLQKFWPYHAPNPDFTPVGRSYRVGDFNGDGRSDFLYIADKWGGYVYLSTGIQPDLLAGIASGGVEQTIVSYAVANRVNGVELPFVAHVVSSMTRYDGIDPQGETTTYEYFDAQYDQIEREFLGFGLARAIHPDGSMREFHFDQGAFKGEIVREALFDNGDPANPVLVNEKLYTWQALEVGQGYPDLLSLKYEDTLIHEGSTPVSMRTHYKKYEPSNGELLHIERFSTSEQDSDLREVRYQCTNLGEWNWRRTEEVAEGHLTGEMRRTNWVYDTFGNVASEIRTLAGGPPSTILYTHTPEGNIQSRTDENGNVHTFEYDSASATFITTVTAPSTGGVSHVTNTVVDPRYGRTTQSVDENGNPTVIQLDPFGREIASELRSAGGQLVSKRSTLYVDGPTPVIKRSAYVEFPDETVDTYEYFDMRGRKIRDVWRDADGRFVAHNTRYDSMDRAVLEEGPFLVPVQYTDPLTIPLDLAPSSTVRRAETEFAIDGRPLEIRRRGADGSMIVHQSWSYGRRQQTITDADGKSQTKYFDAYDQIVRVDENSATPSMVYTMEYVYNSADELVSITDHLGNVIRYTYDTLGRRTRIDDPTSGASDFLYYPDGSVAHKRQANYNELGYLYDELGRMVVETTDQHGTTLVSHTYDDPAVPNGIGRRTATTNSVSTIENLEYDAAGRLLRVRRTLNGEGVTREFSFGYDPGGRLVSITYPSGLAVGYSYYPGTNLLHQVTGPGGVVYVAHEAYDLNGKVSRVTYHDGISETRFDFNPYTTRLGRVVAESAQSSSNPDSDQQLDAINQAFFYSPAGDVVRVEDYRRGADSGLPNNTMAFSYSYDDHHRLTSEFVDHLNRMTEGYAYDALGRRIAKVFDSPQGFKAQMYNYSSSRPHLLTSVSFEGATFPFAHDLSGNMVSSTDFRDVDATATRTMTYDLFNRVISLHNAPNLPDPPDPRDQPIIAVLGPSDGSVTGRSGGSGDWLTMPSVKPFSVDGVSTLASGSGGSSGAFTVTFDYDGNGERIRKRVVPGSETFYHGPYLDVVDGVVHEYVTVRGQRVARLKAGSIRYNHLGRLGSVEAVTDATGTVRERLVYSPFGELVKHWGEDETDYRYIGQEEDSESGLQNLNARLYDPNIGRFLGMDPKAFAFDPQLMNPYSYARNNPMAITDASGEFIDPVTLSLLAFSALVATVDTALSDDPSFAKWWETFGYVFTMSNMASSVGFKVEALVAKPFVALRHEAMGAGISAAGDIVSDWLGLRQGMAQQAFKTEWKRAMKPRLSQDWRKRARKGRVYYEKAEGCDKELRTDTTGDIYGVTTPVQIGLLITKYAALEASDREYHSGGFITRETLNERAKQRDSAFAVELGKILGSGASGGLLSPSFGPMIPPAVPMLEGNEWWGFLNQFEIPHHTLTAP